MLRTGFRRNEGITTALHSGRAEKRQTFAPASPDSTLGIAADEARFLTRLDPA